MKSTISNKQGTIQTKSDILWIIQFTRDISTDDK